MQGLSLSSRVLLCAFHPGIAALRVLHPEEAAWLGAFRVPGAWWRFHEKTLCLHHVAPLRIRDLFRGGKLFPECQARGQVAALHNKFLVLPAIACILLREGLRGAADLVLSLYARPDCLSPRISIPYNGPIAGSSIYCLYQPPSLQSR